MNLDSMRHTAPAGLARRNFLAGAGGAGLTALLAACGSSGAGPAVTATGGGTGNYTGPAVKLAFWNSLNGPDGAYWKKLIDTFNSQTPRITVAFDVYDAADLAQKMPAAINAGNGPELSFLNIDAIPTYAAQGLIVAVDDLVSALHYSASEFTDPFWNGCRYQQQQYGVPAMLPMLGMYYNKKLLQQAGLDPESPPTTGEEYGAALAKLKEKGIQGHWMSPFYFTGVFQWQSVMNQYGGSLVSADGKTATFDSDAGIKALQWCADMVSKGYSPANVGQDADYNAFKAGKSAFNWNGNWQITDLQATTLEWGLAPLPVIGTSQAIWGDGAAFVLTKKAAADPNKSAAAQHFVNWMSQHSISIAAGGDVPAAGAARSSSAISKYPYVKTLADVADKVVEPPTLAGFADVQTQINTAINNAVLGHSSPANALHAAAKQATTILRANAAQYGD